MPNSFAQTAPLTCPKCQKEFEAEVWLIVDAAEQPALLAKVETGKLHQMTCPHCQYVGSLDMPLLVYRPGQEAALVFSPAQGTDEASDQQHLQMAMGTLRESLGDAWQTAWEQSLKVIPRDVLTTFLHKGEQAAREQWYMLHPSPQSAAPTLPPELQAVFAELSRSGVAIRTPEDLERALDERPDLRAMLNQAIRPGQE
jgi:hypothetical protein